MSEQDKPHNWYDVAAEVSENIAGKLKPVVREAADELYGRLLESVQDYLVSNTAFNIGSTIDVAQREARSLRAERDTLKAENERLRTWLERVEVALIDHNDFVRSAFVASQRDAANDVNGTTNYRLLADRAHTVLTQHHVTVAISRVAL